jgi:predicted MFS family arabinose efflux permease
MIGSSVTFVALPLVAVVSLHASTFLVTLLSASTWFPWLLLGLPAGAWVDRLSPRRVMLACDAVSFAAFASVPVCTWLGVLTIAQLIAVALAAGSAAVLFSTAYQVLVPGIVAEEDLAEANAKLAGSRSVSRISGPGLAGALAELAGPPTGLLADAVSFAVSFICLVRLRDHQPVQGKPDSAPRSLARETAEGLRFVWRDPYLRAQMLFGGASNLTLTGVDALIVVFLVRNAGLDAAAVGLVMATFGIGGVLGTVIARPLARRLGTARTMTVCTIGGLPFALLLPLGHSGPRLAFVIATSLVVTAALVASSIIGTSFRQAYVPAAMLGRVSSFVMTVSYSTLPAGAILAGTLATKIGIRPAMWVLTAGIATSGLVFLTTPMCRLRELPTRPVRSSLTPWP